MHLLPLQDHCRDCGPGVCAYNVCVRPCVKLKGRAIALHACTAIGSCTQVLFVARVLRMVLNEHVALWRDTNIVQRMVAWLVCMCTVRLLAEGAFFGRDQHACGIATFQGICHNKDAISIV